MSLHIVPVRVYVTVFLALMVFTVATVALAFIDLGAMNDVLALAIALIKATLVILFFMHVRYTNSRLIPLVVVGGLLWLGILFAFTLSDYFTRGMLAS
jgi:cytochrome c oxidase subunit 4